MASYVQPGAASTGSTTKNSTRKALAALTIDEIKALSERQRTRIKRVAASLSKSYLQDAFATMTELIALKTKANMTAGEAAAKWATTMAECDPKSDDPTMFLNTLEGLDSEMAVAEQQLAFKSLEPAFGTRCD